MVSEKVRLQILCLGRGLLFGEPIMGCSVSSCRHRSRCSARSCRPQPSIPETLQLPRSRAALQSVRAGSTAEVRLPPRAPPTRRSEEHTSELQSLMRISYAVFCLKKKKTTSEEKPTQSQPSHITHCNASMPSNIQKQINI